MKLKTLKDLQSDPIMMKHCNWVVSVLDLKQETIKWVKKFSIKTEEGIEMSHVASAFKNFFNITDEDLK